MFVTYGTSHSIALGGAIGMRVGLSPTVGLQSVIALTLAVLFKANPVTAYAPVWITNPVTIPFIYYFNTRFGAFILRRSEELNWAYFKTINFSNFLDKLGNMLGPLIVGSLIVGVICASISYPIFFYVADRIRKRRVKQDIKWRGIVASASISEKFPFRTANTPTSKRLSEQKKTE